MALLRQQARAEWLSLLVWSASLWAMMFYFVFLWQSLVGSGAMRQLELLTRNLPESLRNLYGAGFDFTSITGWLQAFAFGGWVMVPLIIYASLFVAGMITREVDRHTAEFLLALPVARWQVVLSRFAGLAAALLVLHVAHMAGVAVGVLAVGQSLALGSWAIAELNSFLVMLAISSVFLVITVFIDDYGAAVGTTVGLGLAMFFYQAVTERSSGLLKLIRGLCLLPLYDPAPILSQGTVPWSHMGVLAAVCVAGLGLAAFLFEKKQVRV